MDRYVQEECISGWIMNREVFLFTLKFSDYLNNLGACEGHINLLKAAVSLKCGIINKFLLVTYSDELSLIIGQRLKINVHTVFQN